MINPKTKTLPSGVDYTKDGTWGISANADRGTPPWVSGRTAKSPGKAQTVNDWRLRRQIQRLCRHGNQGRSVVVFSFFFFFLKKVRVRYTEN